MVSVTGMGPAIDDWIGESTSVQAGLPSIVAQQSC